MSVILSDLKRVGKGNGIYENSIDLQRRNPINKKKIKPIFCKLCIEKQVSTTGRKATFRKINEIHAHCSFDHPNENFKPYLISLIKDVFYGRLK